LTMDSPVSTSAQLLHCLQLDDLIYGVVGAEATKPEGAGEDDNGVKLWNIPGLGVLGVGAATAAIIAIYVANPGIKETLQTVSDLFGDEQDEKLDTVAETIGQKGDETKLDAPPADGEPRIADAMPVANVAPKAGAKPVDATPATPAPEMPTVSRGAQIPGSGMPLQNGPLARPSAAIEQVLQNTAKTEGVDYRTLYALGGAESSFSVGANAKNSSATGLFQFTAPTWQYLTQKVYPELGYKAGDRTDPQKSSVVAARYIKSIKASLRKKLGREPSIGEAYLGYFMGPTGASSFLDVLQKNPNAKGANVFPKAAEANPNLFYHKGDKKKPLTLRETMDRLEGKVTAYYEQAGATQVAQAETPPPVSGGPGPMQVKASLPADASPKALQVPPADFGAAKGGAKGEARDVQQKGSPKRTQQVAQNPIAISGSGSTEQPGEVAYVRDKQGRIITIRS
jgi:hypothetical protein